MEVDNKPNQTDPSVDEAQAANSEEESLTLDDLIKERVKAAIDESKGKLLEEDAKVLESKNEGGSGSDVSTQRDSSSVTDPNKEVLSLVEGVLGRKFESVEDVKKTLSNLNSLVGDQAIAKTREDARLFDTFVTKWASGEGKTVEEAKKFWADTLTGKIAMKPIPDVAPVTQKPVQAPEPTPRGDNTDKVRSEVEDLKFKFERSELLAKYPMADEVKDEVAIVARQRGISQIEAFEQSPLKALVETKAKEESKKSPVVTSSNRIGFDQKKVQELGKKVLQRGDERDKIELVKATLGL